MKKTEITLTERELAYLLVALRNYEKILMDSAFEENEMGDEVGDLLMIQHLKKRLAKANGEIS